VFPSTFNHPSLTSLTYFSPLPCSHQLSTTRLSHLSSHKYLNNTARMSRVTPPVTKFTQAIRRISSSANAARPSGLLDSEARTSAYLPRKISDLKAECAKRQLKTSGSKSELVGRLTAHDIIGSHGFQTSSGHRPTNVQPSSVFRTIHLMQGFKTSAPKQAAHDASTIDFMFFPEIKEAPPLNPFAKLRVPLLPDNYHPDRSPGSVSALETLDEALPGPQISIIASHPENVAPASISEVVGNDGLDVDIKQLSVGFSETPVRESGVLKELWSGLVDDILGPKGPKLAV